MVKQSSRTLLTSATILRISISMDTYEQQASRELNEWKRKMQQSPSLLNKLTKKVQTRVNALIPEKVHIAITTAIKQMTRTVLFGAGLTTAKPVENISLEARENQIRQRINFYKNTAATEGAITGAGGILLGLADFPLWLTLKIKMLFEIASLYGYNTNEFKERVYLLYIFQLTFSSKAHRRKTYDTLTNWEEVKQKLPTDINQLDWRNFQQEYRDYIDVAKLLQLIPGIGAAVGALVNHQLTDKLGMMAMNAYRLRWEITQQKQLEKSQQETY